MGEARRHIVHMRGHRSRPVNHRRRRCEVQDQDNVWDGFVGERGGGAL
jgi:hypothetical protein